MIIKNFLTGRHIFIVARHTFKNPKADQISNYWKYVERSLIFSLLITLILLQYQPYQKKYHYDKQSLKVALEVIDIPVTRQELPPPPVQEVITNYRIIIQNEQNDVRNIREQLEKVTLDLKLETNNNLLASSQIDNFNYTDFARNRARLNESASLDISTELNPLRNHDGGGLDFTPGGGSVSKRSIPKAVEMDSPLLPAAPKLALNEPKNTDSELIKINANQFLLKESESTIGTSEYRLWNKINAALDRLDKNRFGKLPENIQRTKKGLIVTFRYDDGKIHDIFWSKGGKVVIRVTGNHPQQQIMELQKAFDALISLTL